MNKVFKTYLKQLISFHLKNPLFYVISFIFSIFIPANFYFKQQFFGATGSTDLILLFSFVPYISILIIPSLCYKTSNLIYENFIPLKQFEKIVARFISILILFGLILLICIPSALCVNFFGSIDISQLISSICVLFLYGSSTIALTILLTELIQNQIAAIFISAIFLTIINSAHIFTISINTNSFFATFLKKISFAWHFDAASKGIIDTRDILFFISTTILFLTITYICKTKKMGKNALKYINISSVFAILIICILVNLNSNKYFKRFDLSKNKTYSVSNYSKELISNLKSPLKVTYYRSSSLTKYYPQIRDISDFLNSYAQLSKNISLQIQDPDKNSNLTEFLQNYGIYGQQMKNVNNNSTEFLTVFSSIILEYEGKYEIIPFLLSSETLEYDLDKLIKNFIKGKKSKVNIILGNENDSLQNYTYLMLWLNSQGFDFEIISSEDKDFYKKFESLYGNLLVIGDSNIDIEKAILIESYILEEKGNVLFNLNPYTVDIEGNWLLTQNKKTNLIEMLENWGFIFTEKIAADVSCAQVTFYSQDTYSDQFNQNPITEIINYPLWISLLPQIYCKTGATLFWPTPLSIQEDSTYNVKPYLISSNSAYAIKVDRRSPDKLIETDPFIIKNQNAKEDKSTQLLGVEITGSLSGLYTLNKCNKSHIFVIPDNYFLHNLTNGYIGGELGDYRNYELAINLLFKLEGEEELADLQSKTARDTSLFKILDNESLKKQQTKLFTIVFAIVPFIIILSFILVKICFYKKIKNEWRKYEK